MPLPQSVIPRLPEVFRELRDRFGFVVHVEDEYHLTLRAPRCVVAITFERYEGLDQVEIIDPQDQSRPYNLLLLRALRDPDSPRVSAEHRPAPDETDVPRELRWVSNTLLRLCPEMLAGDFGPARREGYHEFDAYVSSRFPALVNLALDDPVSVKFWKADLTWAWDLWEREHPGEPKPVWWAARDQRPK